MFFRLFAALVLLSGCASINRATEYQANFADAKNFGTAFEIEISVHPREDMLLLSPRTTLSGPIFTPPEPSEYIMRQAATEFIGDTGCSIGAIRQMVRPWFEAAFTCPADFDIRAAMAAQREQLRDGTPLRR